MPDSEYTMSQQPPVRARTQGVDLGPAIFVTGFLVSFLAFNALGQDIAREAQKELRERIRAGGLRLPTRKPGEPRPRPAEAAELPEEAVLVLGLNSITKKIKESGCISQDVLAGFNLQYAARGEDLLKDINRECIQTKIRAGVTPLKPGDVGFMVKATPNPEDSAFRIISFGWPARGRELELPLKNWADWLANPYMQPMYSKVK